MIQYQKKSNEHHWIQDLRVFQKTSQANMMWLFQLLTSFWPRATLEDLKRGFIALALVSIFLIDQKVIVRKRALNIANRHILYQQHNVMKVMYICWLVTCSFPLSTKAACLCTKLRSRSTFVLSGKLHVASQHIFFPVNGPFVRFCLGQICL